MRKPQGELRYQLGRLLDLRNALRTSPQAALQNHLHNLRIGSDIWLAQTAQAARDAHVSNH
jgi:hypothetical protein